MSAFTKAVELIEAIAAREGGYPQSINVTRYRSAREFARFYPGEDFAAHQRHMSDLVAWCEQRGIVVAEKRPRGATPSARAKNTAQPPYRLGLKIHGPNKRRQRGDKKPRDGALGWFTVELGGQRKNEGGES